MKVKAIAIMIGFVKFIKYSVFSEQKKVCILEVKPAQVQTFKTTTVPTW